MTRSFTNREDLAGQQVDPGKENEFFPTDVWEYVPNAGKRVEPDYSKIGSYATVDGNPVSIDGQQNPFLKDDLDPATAPTQPIETLERNIPMDRNKFQESLLQQFKGEDPTKVNISAKATNIVIGSLQKLWGHVFQDKVPWGGRLTEDQAKFWNKEKSSYYANVYNKILEQNKLDRETMKSALDRFDDEAKRIEDAKYKETPAQQEARTRRTETFKAGLKSEKVTTPEFIKKRDEMMDVYGVDEKTATGLATGTLRINTNPVSGESVIVDMVTGTSKPINEMESPVEKPKVETSRKPQKQTLWEMADLSTGIFSAGKAAWGATAGQVGLPIAKKTEYARQRVRSAQQKLVRALSINPRYPVAEQERIREETRIAPEIFDSSQSLRVRMRALNDYLESEITTNQDVASNRKMPTDIRQAALQAEKDIESFLRELGVPKLGVPKEKSEGTNLSKEDIDLINKYLTK